jgi:alkanesulfonate monooxygenase SsuD/methylene tetrahydromethanopterin reductase-like flavin-dependent oxidoreductase (luciferase family)/hemerythrin-like domain-containing protein
MPDYGHDLEFGVFLPPAADRAGETLMLARTADELGLDLVSVQDHPYNSTHLDTWTLLSVIAASTRSVRVFPNVANLPLRPPAVLARSAASLDLLSGGRVELGIGAGAFWDAIAAMDGPRRTTGESVEALAEAIGVIRALWTPGRSARLPGEHYRLDGARPGPFPAHPIGIWVGAYGPRMLRLTGRLADGWLPSAPYAGPEKLSEMNATIDAAAEAAGRSPADIRRLYNLAGSFTGDGSEFLRGPAKVWIEQLTELALTEGMSGFVLMVENSADLRRFAEEVAPGVRELVAQERSLSEDPRPVRSRVWDDSERPTGPGVDPNAPVHAGGRASGEQLVAVHDHLREELERVRELVSQVRAGSLDVAAARSEINTMTMRQNNWTLGAYCESYCRVVTMHHTLEDRAFFPQLRELEPRLGPVLDRLSEEHRVIHDVLERVDAALVALVNDPDGIHALADAVDVLSESLLSHLAYEERELVGPIASLPVRH